MNDMNISEKVAYLKGLMEGLDIDVNTKEGKMFSAIVDILDEVALTVEELADEVDALDTVVAEIDEDLGDLEREFYEEDDDCDCGCDCCDCEEFEAECPGCGEIVELDIEDLENGAVVCPHCGEEFEVEIDEDDCDCCDCGCDCCEDEE